MAAFHSPGENHATEFARGHSWERPLEENPNVAALPGARPFEGLPAHSFPGRSQEKRANRIPRFSCRSQLPETSTFRRAAVDKRPRSRGPEDDFRSWHPSAGGVSVSSDLLSYDPP